MEDTYSLDNSNNYKYELLPSSSSNIFKIYVDIINNYISAYVKSISICIKHKDLYHYLWNKGIYTISNIFKILLLNTKNIELTKYHCIKSINYYIEFIEQNNNQAENKIGYAHASLFSYGNTIYKLKKSYRKSSYNILDENMISILYGIEENERYIFSNVELMINLYQLLIDIYFINYSKNTELIPGLIDYITDETTIFISNLTQLSIYPDIEAERRLNNKLTFIIDFVKTTKLAAANLIYILITQLHGRKLTILNKAILLQKILSDVNKRKLESGNDEEYIKWLLY